MDAPLYLSPNVAAQLLMALRQLQEVTGELWSADLGDCTCKCSHGIQVTHLSALGTLPEVLWETIDARHEAARVSLVGAAPS